MAKKAKVEAASEPKTLDTKAKPNGEFHRPFPWVEPYPAAEYDKEGKEIELYTRATVTQELTVSGQKFKTGVQTLPLGLAHAHSAVLSAPK